MKTLLVSHINVLDKPKGDTLSKLYASAAKHQNMSFKQYCTNMWALNEEQQHIVMYNRLWCKDYIQAIRRGSHVKPYRIFTSGLGGTGRHSLLT